MSGRRSHGAGRAGRERGAAQGGSRGEGGGGADEPCGAGEGGRAGALPRSGRREEKGGRRGEKKRKKRRKRKEKRKKMGKRKRKRRGKRREKERGREVRAGITALIAEPVGHAWRPGARERDAQVEGKQGVGYGCRVFGESGGPAEQGGFRKTGVRVSKRDLELNDEAKF